MQCWCSAADMASEANLTSVEDMASETDMGSQAVPVWKAWQVRTTGMASKADMASVVRRHVLTCAELMFWEGGEHCPCGRACCPENLFGNFDPHDP